MMKVKVFNNFNIFASNSYLLIEDNHCLLIDCGFLSDELNNEIKKYQHFEGVILTHKHFDHFRDINRLKSLYNVNIYTYETGDNFFNDSKLNASKYFGETISYNIEYNPIYEGEYSFGPFHFRIIHTPGHTSDSICIYFGNEKILFSGDFIFSNSIGRFDLPTASLINMKESLIKIERILNSNDLIIYSGHDTPFTSHHFLKNLNIY